MLLKATLDTYKTVTDLLIDVYFSFSKTQRKIFYYLRTFTRTRKNCFPSQARIAERCGCTREYANKVIKLFVSMGILKKIVRNGITCLYDMCPTIKYLDLKDPKIWETSKEERRLELEEACQKNPEFTENFTAEFTRIYKKTSSSHKTTKEPSSDLKEKKKLIDSLPVNQRTKQNLKRFSLRTIKIGIQETKKVNHDSFAGFLFSTCKSIEASPSDFELEKVVCPKEQKQTLLSLLKQVQGVLDCVFGDQGVLVKFKGMVVRSIGYGQKDALSVAQNIIDQALSK